MSARFTCKLITTYPTQPNTFITFQSANESLRFEVHLWAQVRVQCIGVGDIPEWDDVRIVPLIFDTKRSELRPAHEVLGIPYQKREC